MERKSLVQEEMGPLRLGPPLWRAWFGPLVACRPAAAGAEAATGEWLSTFPLHARCEGPKGQWQRFTSCSGSGIIVWKDNRDLKAPSPPRLALTCRWLFVGLTATRGKKKKTFPVLKHRLSPLCSLFLILLCDTEGSKVFPWTFLTKY